MSGGSKQLLLLLVSIILAVHLTNGCCSNVIFTTGITDRLEKLRKDLSSFDSLYLSLKLDGQHIKKAEKGVDEIDAKLEGLLKRYDLEDTIYAFRMKYKYNSGKIYSATADPSQTSSNNQHETFNDARLLKMWDTIKSDKGFSLAELDNFYYELREYEQKLDDYNRLLKEISAYEQKHNHILKDEHEEELSEQHEQQLLAVKEMNKALESNLQNMQLRLDQIKQNPFKNEKVRSLWTSKVYSNQPFADIASLRKRIVEDIEQVPQEMINRLFKIISAIYKYALTQKEKVLKFAVKNHNLIPNELDAIKSELRHFEKQLEKMDFHREQLGDAEEFSQGVGKEGASNGHTDELHNYQEKMARKIKKLEHYLDEKVAVAHSEL
uniref:Alpha-2-macroglobulin RAP C-terminal domain-containing protein n=1 Tax=Ditylenchus dipsaci TaxID=166011 RepID=A0A915CKS6_9BILA